jgi:beta-1,4-mannosyltransferase
VRTVHNELPHEVGSGIEQWILRLIDRRTELWIYLGLGGPQRSPSKIMLHGDYREWFSSFDVPEPECGNVVAFGNVRPYKGFDDLIRCFSTIESDFRLTVAGLPLNSDVRNTILAAATAPNISLELRALSDQELARLIGQAECVALPYMEMRNSGALLVSLSLNRPAIVPASDGAARLSAEVGDGWIVMYEPPLSGSKLRQALQEVRSGHRQGQPDLSRRDWRVLGRELADIYAGLA